MSPKAKNPCAERRAPSKIEQATCPETIWKKILEDKQYYRRWVSISHKFPQRAKNFTDVGRRYELERGEIKYTKAVNVFGLVTKSWQSKLTMKRYEKHSKRQGARANHPKQSALPERRAPKADYPPERPKQTTPLERRAPSAVRRAPCAERRAPSAHFFRASRLLGVSLQLGWFGSDFFSLKTVFLMKLFFASC